MNFVVSVADVFSVVALAESHSRILVRVQCIEALGSQMSSFQQGTSTLLEMIDLPQECCWLVLHCIKNKMFVSKCFVYCIQGAAKDLSHTKPTSQNCEPQLWREREETHV